MRNLSVGEWVYVLYPTELQLKVGKGWSGPFLTVKKLGDVNYVIQKSPESRKITLHVDHLKKYVHDDTPTS